MMMRWFGFLLVIFFVTACVDQDPQVKKVPVKINGYLITAIVRDTPLQREQGLMGYPDLAKNQGMLFVFSEAKRYTFWMKNMRFALDMIWIGTDKKVVDISAHVPICKPTTTCALYSPAIPAQYVLELKSGMAEKLHVRPGTTIDFTLPS